MSSRLHQQKVLRALKWKLLDLGERPGAPRNLACFCRSDAGVHAVQWSPPVSNGYPPVHGYVVQARRPGERWVGEGVWVYAAVQHDKRKYIKHKGAKRIKQVLKAPYRTME